ncbi:MAG: transposase [Rhodocyclaceae bacterium]|jgi:REP element-mobilizing transposase RayT|nr:transposase [Rhodocyclaceae bacterium]
MTYNALRIGRFSEIGRAYNITTVTAGRVAVFADFSLARIVICQMRALHDEGLVESMAWVLMPDHLHWLLVLRKGDLASAMRVFKARSARAVNVARACAGALWQPSYFDHGVRDDEDVRGLARYIVANPCRAGLVPRPGDYPHWDAAWL